MATKLTTLNGTSWTDLGTTPCFIEMRGTNEVIFVIDTAAPADITAKGHTLSDEENQGQRSANISLTGQRVFARAERPGLTAEVIVSR